MGDKRALMAKAVFGVAAIVYCAVLSLRPIPAVNAPNDTGRYVDSQEESCRTEALGDESDNLPQRAFNLLVRPTCQAGKYRVFLFCISLFLPAALMLFGDWSADGALFLMLGFLFSAVGFELMTNALRQTASLAFLLAAISFRVRWAQFAALACALLLHDSSWVFIPCALYVNRRGNLKPSAKRRLLVISGSAAVAIVGLIALEQRYSAQVSGISSLIALYTQKYAEAASPLFIAFMVLPTCLIFVVRRAQPHSHLSSDEKMIFVYSTVVMLVTAAFFPAITYRFAMTAMVLQLFVTMRSADFTVTSGLLISTGLVLHFLAYAAISPNVWAVLHG